MAGILITRKTGNINRILPVLVFLSLCVPALAGRIYVSNSGTNTPPYSSPATATDSIRIAVDSLNGGGPDTIWFNETGTYMLAEPCSLHRDGMVMMGAPGTRCTLEFFPSAVIGSTMFHTDKDTLTFKNLIFNGNNKAINAIRAYALNFYALTIDSCEFFYFKPATASGLPQEKGVIVTTDNTVTGIVRDCFFHDINGNVLSIKDNGTATNQFEIARNRFVKCGNAVQVNDGGYNRYIHHNLVLGCTQLYNCVNDTPRNDTLLYNTVVNCSGPGIVMKGNSTAGDWSLYKYNICWGNAGGDFVNGTGIINNYTFSNNCFDSLVSGITAGAGNVTSYPLFADTTMLGGYDLRFGAGSDCVDTTGDNTAWTDLDGKTTPFGTFNDLGCYEYSGGGPGFIDSVHYFSCGTPEVNDDSMIVWFRENVEYDSLPVGGGLADSVFGVRGMGKIWNASIDTHPSYSDTNFIYIEMNAGDTILSHNRSRLLLKENTVWNTLDVPAVADTDTVVTHNISVRGAGTEVRDLPAALTAAFSTDSIVILDAGVYDDPFTVGKNVVIQGRSQGDSLPVLINRVFRDTVFHATNACTVVNVKMVANPHSNPNLSMVWFGGTAPRIFAFCEFEGSDTAQRAFNIQTTTVGDLIVDSSSFSGFKGDIIYSRMSAGTQRYRGNIFQNSDVMFGGIYLYPTAYHTVKPVIAGNMFFNLAGGPAVFLRQSEGVRIVGNLVQDCYAGIAMSNENSRRCYVAFNTVVQCTTFGIKTNSAAGFPDTVKYNISWSNGSADLDTLGQQRPVADYNFYQSGNAPNWLAGPHSASGYPGFVDTLAGNYTLADTSPCIDFTDFTVDSINAHQIPPADIDGFMRVNGSFADCGALEETTLAALIRIRTKTDFTVTSQPGDTITYTIWYDNDGDGVSADTGIIAAHFPRGTMFLDTLVNRPDTGRNAWAAGFRVEYLHRGTWLKHIPWNNDLNARDSLAALSAIRYVVPPGIGADPSGARIDDAEGLAADDSLDSDAGYMKFRVRIR